MKILTKILVASALSVLSVSATPILGQLIFNGTVNVSVSGLGVTTIDFLPLGVGGEAIAGLANSGTFLPFNTATVPQRTGVVKDISSSPGSFPIPNWLSFALSGIGGPLGTMNIQLNSLIGSSAPVVAGCVGLAVNDSCSPQPGSVFTLTRTSTGTTVSLSGVGVVIDGLDSLAFQLSISTQFGMTPDSVLTQALAPGGISNSFSATLSTVPEPATWALAAMALGFIGLRRR